MAAIAEQRQEELAIRRPIIDDQDRGHDRVCALSVRRTRLLLTDVEIERRSFIEPALGPDPAAVALDHAPHRGEPDADTLEFVPSVQALEYVEQLSPVTHVEAHAVVAHENHRLPVVRGLRSDLDLRLGLS